MVYPKNIAILQLRMGENHPKITDGGNHHPSSMPPDRSGISGMPSTFAHLGTLGTGGWHWVDPASRVGIVKVKNSGSEADFFGGNGWKMNENGMIWWYAARKWQKAIGYPNVYSKKMRDSQSTKVGSWVLEKRGSTGLNTSQYFASFISSLRALFTCFIQFYFHHWYTYTPTIVLHDFIILIGHGYIVTCSMFESMQKYPYPIQL